VRIGKEQDGATVTVRAGQDVVVELPSNPTTGHDWVVERQSEALGPPATEFVPPGDQADGARGTRRFVWKTAGLEGEHEVALVYKRPADKTKPPADTFSFTLRLAN